MEDLFLILVGLAWALGTPLLAIVALVRTQRLHRENERLAADVALLRRRLSEAALPPPFAASAPGSVAATASEANGAVAPPLNELPGSSLPVTDEATGEPAPTESLPVAMPKDALPTIDLPPFVPATAVSVSAGWEQRLGARAFVWVGAVTLALAAVFLVRYSIEEGYLSPEVRVILAALFGFALIGVAERIGRRDGRVAQALAAAGVAALYGALFAAVSLYDMISKVAAGGGAAALTAFAIGVSLRHGIFVAVLAFVGGFVSPAIIGADTPNTPVLFGYLLAIAAGTLAVIRVRGWWPLGWGVLAGSAAWTLLWMSSLAGGLPWVGLFLVALAGLFVWATWRRLAEGDKPPVEAIGAGLGGARRHRRPDRRRHPAGRGTTDRRLAGAGGTRRGPLRAGALDAALPVRRGAGAGAVARGPGLGGRQTRRLCLDACGLCSAASTPSPPSPCCGTPPGRASGRPSASAPRWRHFLLIW